VAAAGRADTGAAVGKRQNLWRLQRLRLIVGDDTIVAWSQ
jgi:hypothetical protein